MFALVAAGVICGGGVRAQGFDYLLMALTWTPSFCMGAGERDGEQCDPERDLGFTLHGLWPQYEDGWPEFCESREADPTRAETAAMADIMGSGGLAWYQWKKHGRCTGWTSDRYFTASRMAYGLISLPEPAEPELTAEELERAFVAANPGLDEDDLVITCRDDRVQEVRICLDADLAPRSCGADVLRSACRYRGDLELPPIP